MPAPNARPLLSEDQAAFVSGPVSIVAASCLPGQRSTLARVQACQVDGERRGVVIVLHSEQAAELLGMIDSGAAIAVAYSDPQTHRSLQLKGYDARRVELPSGKADALAEAHTAEFTTAVEPMGFSPALTRTVIRGTAAPLVAIAFTPEAAYLQTPGPGAGARLP